MAHLHQRWAEHRRRAIATGLDNLVREAHAHPPVLTAQVPFQRQDVLEARDDLALLAQALRTNPRPNPDGIAAANHLLTSCESPIFEAQGPQAIRAAARAARDALA